jgi:hypothetical protein
MTVRNGLDMGAPLASYLGYRTKQGAMVIGAYPEGYIDGFADGSKNAFPKGMSFARAYSHERGIEEGRYQGYNLGFLVGHASGGTTSNTTPPTITITATPVLRTDPLIFQVYDDLGLATYQVTCKDRSDGSRLVVYDPADGFDHPFTSSTVTGSGTVASPYIFTLYRSGGWQTGLTFNVKIRAVDNTGNVSVS